MNLPFTTEQFFEVFGQYNNFTWMFMILFYIAAIVCLYLIYKKSESASKFTLWLLAVLWLWMGIVYHLTFFSPINKAAYLFGAFFIIQGLLLARVTFKQNISLAFKKNGYTWTGIFFIIFALILYPVIGMLAGHSFPKAPMFGVPCPTTIFTLGIFLLSVNRFPKHLLIIPVIWSMIGFFAATNLGVPQDYMLLISAIISTALIIYKK